MSKKMILGQKRAVFVDVTDYSKHADYALNAQELAALTKLDLAYRTLVAILFNYVPTSGHPGGVFPAGGWWNISYIKKWRMN